MHFVLTNDDGIDAVGLDWLAQLAANHGTAQVVAPHEQQSGVGHRVSVRRPVRCEPRGEGRYAVFGTPADCVRVALRGLGIEADWVLSGLNHGGNLGADLAMSGTVAGAREGALLGCQAIALSQVLSLVNPPDPPRIQRQLRRVLSLLLSRPLPMGQFYNVNLPFVPGDEEPEIVFCEPDPSPHDVRYRREGDTFVYEGTFLKRPRIEGYDVAIALDGKIAVSVVPAV